MFITGDLCVGIVLRILLNVKSAYDLIFAYNAISIYVAKLYAVLKVALGTYVDN